jgi:hypothetical protein
MASNDTAFPEKGGDVRDYVDTVSSKRQTNFRVALSHKNFSLKVLAYE